MTIISRLGREERVAVESLVLADNEIPGSNRLGLFSFLLIKCSVIWITELRGTGPSIQEKSLGYTGASRLQIDQRPGKNESLRKMKYETLFVRTRLKMRQRFLFISILS